MKNDWMQGVLAGLMAIGLAAIAYGQQPTPPPATDYAPAAPAGDFPAPMARPASPLDGQSGGRIVDDGSTANTAGSQRGELGVWLVESGGPGVQVRRVTEGSAADMAGLEAGDVILGINGRGANSPYTIAQMIRQLPAGQAATVRYWRDGETNDLEVVLQPAREQYEVAFRGDGSPSGISRPSGDLETRVMRLEQQLAALTQELRQLRQLHHGSSDQAATATGADAAVAPGAAATQPTATPSSSTPPQNDDAFGQPAAQPVAGTPASAPAAGSEPAGNDDDLFGASTTEEPAATATEAAPAEAAPAEGAAAPDAAPATEAGSDDLFE